MTTYMKIHIRVYYKVALYPQDTFNADNCEDDYDFVKDRENNFNLHLVTDNKAAFVTKQFIECCNWNKEDDEYINKISYYGNGLFIADLYFSSLHLHDIRDVYYEIDIKDTIIAQLCPDNNNDNDSCVNINDTYYELDLEIESVYKINSNGKELELLFTNNEEAIQKEDDDEEEEIYPITLHKEENEELNKTQKKEKKKLLKKQITVCKKPNSNIIHTEMDLEMEMEMEIEDYDD